MENQVRFKPGSTAAPEMSHPSPAVPTTPAEPAPAPIVARSEAPSPFARAVSEWRADQEQAATNVPPEAAPSLEPAVDPGPGESRRDWPEGL